MPMHALLCRVAVLTALVSEVPTLTAGDLALVSHRITGGGGRSAAGRYAMHGSVGQPEAGARSGSGFTLWSGFWNVTTLPRLTLAQDDLAPIRAHRSLKIPIADLLENDRSVLGYDVSLGSVDALSANGGSVRIVGSWIVYEPPSGPPADDEFGYTVGDGHAGARREGPGRVRLRLAAADGDGPAPNAARIARVGTDVVITFVGVPQRSYRVQYTTSPAPPHAWLDTGPDPVHQAGVDGVFVHVDPSPEDPFRLYRAIANP